MDESKQKPTKDCSIHSEGETQTEAMTAFERQMASQSPKRSTDELMEEIVSDENLEKAIRKVQQNRGVAGVDGMSVESLVPYLVSHWRGIKRALLNGSYKPQPVLRKEIPKPGGGKRALGIPTVVDRVIQHAFVQVLQPMWDPTFSDNSYGFRPERSPHKAVSAARDLICSGYEYVVDIDLEKFFDRVNHDVLMARVARRVEDKRVLKVIRAYLNSGIMDNGLVQPSTEGVPQGGPLSPLLSNLLLDDLDKELERRKLQFVRYADDCNIYVRSERAGLRVLAGITEFLASTLRLRVNEEKSGVGKPWTRKFLGFTFGMSPDFPLLIAPAALKKARIRLRELAAEGHRKSFDVVATRVGKFLRGWLQYFGWTRYPNDIVGIFAHARRRLRLLAWQNWKTPDRREQALMQLGVTRRTAARCARSSKDAWRLSGSPVMQHAMPNAYFHSFGFPKTLNGKSL